MSLSRRGFVQTAVAAGVLALAPDALARTATTHAPASRKLVPIEKLPRRVFTPLNGETFTVLTATTTSSAGFKLVLNEVSDLHPVLRRGDQERFSLLFTASRHSKGELPSSLLTLHHQAIGRFELFISPIDLPQLGRYQVIVDRSRA